MVIGTGKELVSFAERQGAIISQHIWEALTDLDKCAPKSVVENCHSLQQLKAEIAALANELEMQVGLGQVTERIELVKRLRKLSAV